MLIRISLVILKDPELLKSINDFTAQKIGWAVKEGNYDVSLFRNNVHTDKEINSSVKVDPYKECMYDQLDDTLSKLDSNYALIVKEGNIVDVDLFPDFLFNIIGVEDFLDYSLIGHLLYRAERYYRLHPQLILLNLDHWRKVGSPTFGRAKNLKLQNVIRSPENFHDDYTPLWVKKGEGKTTYTNTTGQGSQVISALLENDYKIRPFREKERNLKRCCYDSEKEQISRIFHYLGNPSRMSTNVVYVNPTSLKSKTFKNENDVIVSVASPINLLNRLIERYKNVKRVIFYDISLPALIWTELFFKYIKKYNYELEPLYRFFVECGGEKFVFDDVIKNESFKINVSQYSDMVEHLSNCEILYRFGDITRPSIFSKQNLKDSKNVGVNFTNVWDYQRNILRKDDIEWFEDEYVPIIKKERNFEYLL